MAVAWSCCACRMTPLPLKFWALKDASPVTITAATSKGEKSAAHRFIRSFDMA
jgi:hypothetical protein